MVRTNVLASAALLVFIGLWGCATAQPTAIDDAVRSADSPADHWKIVEYYRAEAAQARLRSEEHRRLAAVYDGPHNWTDRFAELAGDHCRELAALEDQSAARYEQLAVEHERLAQE